MSKKVISKQLAVITKLVVIFFVSLTFVGCFSSTKSIQKIHHNVSTFELLESIILDETKPFEQNKTCQNLLVIFNIDSTLIQHGIYRAVIQKLHQLMREDKITQEQDQNLTSIAVLEHKIKLVDKNLPQLIKTLKKNGVKTICLTNTSIRKFGKIDDLVTFRVGQLHHADPLLDFANQFPEYDDELRAPLAIMHNNQMEEFEFYKGILYSNSISHKIPVQSNTYKTILRKKGLILDCFLNELYREIGWKPAKIIFIDNDDTTRHNPMIPAVYDAMKYKNIDLTAIQYTQIKDLETKQLATMSPREKRLRDKKIDAQLKTLLEEKKWLPDSNDDMFFY